MLPSSSTTAMVCPCPSPALPPAPQGGSPECCGLSPCSAPPISLRHHHQTPGKQLLRPQWLLLPARWPPGSAYSEGCRGGAGGRSLRPCCPTLVLSLPREGLSGTPGGIWGAVSLGPPCPHLGVRARPQVEHCGPGRWWRPQLCLLQAVSSHPYVGDGRGAASLRLLNVLHQDIHPALGQRWVTAIPLLLKHLDGEAQGWALPLFL